MELLFDGLFIANGLILSIVAVMAVLLSFVLVRLFLDNVFLSGRWSGLFLN